MTAPNRTIGPLLGDKIGAADPAPVKPRGSIISCPNDHWLYRLTADIGRGMAMKASQVENIEDTLPPVSAGSPIQAECPYCQEPWRRHIGGGKWQTHFTTGWWPAFGADA